MVSNTMRPTGDDKCSDLKDAVKCFEAIIRAAKTRLSNEEIESFMHQAFNLESSPKRLGDLANRGHATNRAMFCMTTFCASVCRTFEATVNINVNFTLQVCGHRLPGCGAKRASHEDFISTLRKREEVIPGLQLLMVGRSASHLGSTTNRLLRFYREKAGFEKQPNPAQVLLSKQNLIERVFSPDPDPDLGAIPKIDDAVQDCKATIKRAPSENEGSDDGLLHSNKRVKRSETATPEAEIVMNVSNASGLRQQLDDFMNAETGWLSMAQRLQADLEDREKANKENLIKAEADEKELKSKIVTVKVLQAHVKQLQEDLSQEKQRTGRLSNSIVRVEKQNKELGDEVSRRKLDAHRLNQMNDDNLARSREHIAELQEKLRKSEEKSKGRYSRRGKRHRH